uniref:TTF-type domain-containing protein n=1 Tax=Latimeria chalumnae TaxID=7897 RepID=H3ADU5_LATCH
FIKYSLPADAVFCYPCRNLYCASEYKDNTFMEKGVRNWKKIGEKLNRHSVWESGEITKRLVNRPQLYLFFQILTRSLFRKREYARKITDLLLYLSRQGLALRGSDETETSENRGNFLDLCSLFAKYDEQFEQKLHGTFNLTSHEIQNELLYIVADLVLKHIAEEVRNVGFYCLIADEGHSFKQEQLSICVRYVGADLNVHERFLLFKDCSGSQNAEGIYNSLKEGIETVGISAFPIVAQVYDGASVMSGDTNGVQRKIRNNHPTAIYTHCMAHKLNLVLVDACKINRTASGFFSIMESLYCYFSMPGHHKLFRDVQRSLGIKPIELTSLSDTRWACRWRNVSACKSTLKAIIQCLNELSQPGTSGLLQQVQKCLVVFDHLLSLIQVAHKALQAKKATVSSAAKVVTSTTTTLENMRKEKSWNRVWADVLQCAENVGISIERGDDEGVRRPRKKNLKLRDFIVYSSCGEREHFPDEPQNHKQKWCQQLFFPVNNALTLEIKRRFSEETLVLARRIDAILACEPVAVDKMLEIYRKIIGINASLAKSEMQIARTDIESRGQAVTLKNLRSMLTASEYPNFFKLVQLALTLPVGSVKSETSFSVMRQIKTYLRTTMSQERFSALAILNIESDITEDIDPAEIVKIYASKGNRRLLL